MTAIEIDGAQGEGGGQILRSSLTLSLVTGRAVRLRNIRSGRAKPGLMRQHLTAVRAAAEVGDAQLDGDSIGSKTLMFRPRAIRSGNFAFSIGTAGSGTLVMQTVLPALMLADSPSEVVIEGGTHNQAAPPFEFLAHVYFPLVSRLGPEISAVLERRGFYPAGGGRFRVSVRPGLRALRGLELTERGGIRDRLVTAIVANLPRQIAQREIKAAAAELNWPRQCFHIVEADDSAGPGNIVMIEVDATNVRELFTGFGRLGVRAEQVAREAVAQVQAYLAADVPLGEHLADQILLPLGIAAWKFGAASRFRTLPLSQHSQTHIGILRKFLEIRIRVEHADGKTLVSI
jgi:RNA 3'-terminal phosphate cyclase (ATP)